MRHAHIEKIRRFYANRLKPKKLKNFGITE